MKVTIASHTGAEVIFEDIPTTSPDVADTYLRQALATFKGALVHELEADARREAEEADADD